MLTEFEVRRRMEIIRESPMTPTRKARLLIMLGRSLKIQARTFSHAKAQIAHSADRNSSAGLTRMASSAERLQRDVREEAMEALHPHAPPQIYAN